MNVKQATQVRRKISTCESCKVDELPKVSVLKEPVDAVMWLRKRRRNRQFKQLLDASRLTTLVADDRVCVKHRKLVMNKTRALFEVEFHDDGSTDQVLPTMGKGKFWFTLFWKTPSAVKKDVVSTWIQQGRQLGQVVRGQEKMPKVPRNLAGLTLWGAHDKLKWDIDTRGYSKVYLETMGETVVVKKDGDIILPQGIHAGIPQFTMDELVRLRHFVGMRPSPEMLRGVWLLKKHMGAEVLQ